MGISSADARRQNKLGKAGILKRQCAATHCLLKNKANIHIHSNIYTYDEITKKILSLATIFW